MTRSVGEVAFVFDQHVNGRALQPLRERGIEVVHVAEVRLSTADDADSGEGRLVVTRNYRDFAPLVQAYAGRGESFPGVLFYPMSIRGSDVGGHVQALERWIERMIAMGRNSAQDGFEWLR